MGLYDTIKCEYPLPKPLDLMELSTFDFNNIDYQTKSLHKGMSQYVIRESGILYQLEVINVLNGDNKISETSTWIKSNFSGNIVFYTIIDSDKLNNDYWVEYEVIFSGGSLTNIFITKFNPRDNFSRIKRETEFSKIYAEREALWDKWYMKYLYSHYDRLVVSFFNKFRSACSNISDLSKKLEMWMTPL